LLQIVMSAHKELALDEKSYHVRFGSTCVTGYGPLMRTADYASFDEFHSALQQQWQKLWVEVFSADPAGAHSWETSVRQSFIVSAVLARKAERCQPSISVQSSGIWCYYAGPAPPASTLLHSTYLQHCIKHHHQSCYPLIATSAVPCCVVAAAQRCRS
jgi:hypothetical protein